MIWSLRQYHCEDLKTSYELKRLDKLNLITVHQDATYSVYYISVGSSTCFGCWHPSSGADTAVITASGVDWLQWVKYDAINTNV